MEVKKNTIDSYEIITDDDGRIIKLLLKCGKFIEEYPIRYDKNGNVMRIGAEWMSFLGYTEELDNDDGDKNNNSTWNSCGVTDIDGNLFAVAYGNGTFAAVGDGIAVYSNTGKTWSIGTGLSKNLSTGITSLTNIAYGNGMFVAVGHSYYLSNGSYKYCKVIATSKDGITWTDNINFIEDNDYVRDLDQFNNIVYTNNLFIAVAGQTIYYSSNGTDWNYYTTPFSSTLYDIVHAEGVYVLALGTGKITLSECLDDWTKVSWANTNNSYMHTSRILYKDGYFIALGENTYSGHIADSKLLNNKLGYTISWDVSGTTSITTAAYGNNKWVGINVFGIYYSSDGVNWLIDETMANCINDAKAGLYDITYGNGIFITVCNQHATNDGSQIIYYNP